jgi:Tfp pilus assembly protein PilO
MNLPKHKKTQIILIAAVVAVLCGGLWFGVIQSRNTALAGASSRLTKAQDRLTEAQKWLKNADEIKGEMETALKQLEEMEAQMPRANDDLFAKSYAMLDKAKAGHAVELREVARPEKKEGEKKKDVGLFSSFPYDVSVFSVSGVAHYHDFGKFLADFENNHPYCRVQNVTLGTVLETGAEGATGRLAKEKLAFRMDIVALIKPTQ